MLTAEAKPERAESGSRRLERAESPWSGRAATTEGRRKEDNPERLGVIGGERERRSGAPGYLIVPV